MTGIPNEMRNERWIGPPGERQRDYIGEYVVVSSCHLRQIAARQAAL